MNHGENQMHCCECKINYNIKQNHCCDVYKKWCIAVNKS